MPELYRLESQVRGRKGSNTSSKSTVSLAVTAISEQAGSTQLGQRTSKALVGDFWLSVSATKLSDFHSWISWICCIASAGRKKYRVCRGDWTTSVIKDRQQSLPTKRQNHHPFTHVTQNHGTGLYRSSVSVLKGQFTKSTIKKKNPKKLLTFLYCHLSLSQRWHIQINKSLINLTSMSLAYGRKPEHPEGTQVEASGTCTHHTERRRRFGNL